MALRHSRGRTTQDKADPVPESANPIVVADPRAIVRGPDGTTTWVARCPRCSDCNDENLVAGSDGSARAQCQACGAIVEVRESGVYRTSPTIPPPEE
jgi:ribosomal protein S27E